MKKLLILFGLFIGLTSFAQNPDYHRYGVRTPFTKYISYTTAQRDALTPTSTDRTIIHHKDTGVNRLEQWDGDSWEELGGDGAVQSVQGYIGVVVLDPDDLDDSATTNKFVTATQKGLIDTALQPSAISNEAYNETTWNGVDSIAPSKNAVRDKIETLVTLNTSQTISEPKVFLKGLNISGNDSSSLLRFQGNYSSPLGILNVVGITRSNNNMAFKFTGDGGSGMWAIMDGSLIKDSNKTFTWPNKSGTIALLDDISGGGATQISADSVFVSPTIKGYSNAYDLLEAHQTSIDSIQQAMEGKINTDFRTVSSTSGVFTEAFNESQPNFRLSLDEDTEVEINDAVNGNFIIAEVVNDDVSEDTFKVTFVGTNKNIIAYLDHGEKAYFTMVTNQDDEMIWFRNYEDAGTDKVDEITGIGATVLDWGKSPYYKFNFSDKNDTLSFRPPNASKRLRLEVKQDDVGSRTLRFAQDIIAVGGSLPTLTTTGDAVDVIDFFYDKENNKYYLEDVKLNFGNVTGTPALVLLSTSGKDFVSSGYSTNGPENSFDGNPSTYSSSTNQASGWMGVDFGAEVTVQKIELLARQGGGTNTARINGVQLRYSNNGTTWTNVGTVVSGVDDMNYTQYVVKTFSPVSARYWGWINTTSFTYSGNVAEVRIWGYED